MDAFAESLDWSARWVQQARTTRSTETLHVGASIVERDTGVVRLRGTRERLRRKELQLLEYLHSKASAPCTRAELLEQVWHCHPDLSTRTVDQTVATLRRKLGDNPRQPELLETVFGIGYRLNTSVSVQG